MPNTLRLVLGDQLNPNHPWFKEVDDSTEYVLMETRSETDYARHHIQKVLGFFAAMRRFSAHLQEKGHRVTYIQISDSENEQSISGNIQKLLAKYDFSRFEYQLPDEWRLDQELSDLCESLDLETKAVDTNHFYTERRDLEEFFEDRKQIVMEYFYREMRKKHDVLMDDGKPTGGDWNYDQSNRKKLPKDHEPPAPKELSHDLRKLLKEIESAGVETIGNVNAEAFIWPLDEAESREVLEFFLQECLPRFGDFQDAMSQDYWSIYHARISFSLNLKMISPKEVVDTSVQYWLDHQDQIDISQIEGFVRQIIGWREFMRGIYWWKMPDFAQMNFFEHDRPLPKWFWTGETKMNCLKQAITGSLENAYAHHIQRLMVTGNFALLAGCDPNEIDAWYLGIYIDAIEWVEITNTRGMSQFADGGIVGTKPYIASGSYMHKMGDYCKHCSYDHKKKTGQDACPLNSIYWQFFDRQRDKLENNRRLAMMYRTWDKMDSDKQEDYLRQAEKYLSEVDYL